MRRIWGVISLDGEPVTADSMAAFATGGAPASSAEIGWAQPAPFLVLGSTASDSAASIDRGPSVWLTADARLDNRDELARLLGAAAGTDDAQLLLRAYLRWDEGCVERLLGDFAFAVWDERRQCLVCARDHLGMKPLHYARAGGLFVFASELGQVLAHERVSADLDEAALRDFLANDARDETRTWFRAVRRLPPAHTLTLSGGGLSLRRYWKLDPSARLAGLTDDDYADRFRETFAQAVDARLRTEGACVAIGLSGGLDSSAVAATARHLCRPPRPLLACTYAFPNTPECDERRYTVPVARELDLELVLVDGERPLPLSQPPDPISPLVAVTPNRAALARAAESGARVYLTGHMGRWGRGGNGPGAYAERLRRGQLRVFAELTATAHRLGRSPLRLLFSHLVMPLFPPLARATGRMQSGAPAWVVQPPWREQARARARRFPYGGGLEAVGRAVGEYDRLAAPLGIEVRHPLLDRRVVELVFALPPEQIFRVGEDRRILRRAMRGIVPPAVLERQRKTTFMPLIERELRSRAAELRSVLRNPLLATLGLVDAFALRAAFERFLRTSSNDQLAGELWFSVTLERWLRALLESEEPRTAERLAARP
jgi:asparagine synthase (glutamine-hydrolysing)